VTALAGKGSSPCGFNGRAPAHTRGHAGPFYGRRGERRCTQRQVVDTSAVWARHGGVHGRSTAATPLGERRRSTQLARALVARGARGEGRDSGSTREGPTAHGPKGAGRPQHAGPAGPRRGHRATPARARALERPVCQTISA
jgi:hypothetical protein